MRNESEIKILKFMVIYSLLKELHLIVQSYLPSQSTIFLSFFTNTLENTKETPKPIS